MTSAILPPYSAKKKYDELIKLGIALSAERNIDILLRQILDGALSLSNADAGTIYIKTQNDTLSFAIRSRNDDLPSFELPLHDSETEKPNNHYIPDCIHHNHTDLQLRSQ